MDEESKYQRKKIIYVAVSLVLFLSFWLVRDFTWLGNTQLHTLMELTATLLAIFTGIMALVRFYSKKNNTFLFIGVGFFGTAFLDGYHTLATSSFFDHVFPSVPSTLIPWSWGASRLFLSVLMFLSWWAWRREISLGERGKISEKSVFLIVGVLTLATFLFFAFFPLPRAYYPEYIVGRPEEFVSAVFFLVALIGYYRKGKWRDSSFEHWIMLSLIVGFIGQVIFMPFSFGLFDGMFSMAHLLKKTSYLFVLIGLFSNMYQLFKQLEHQKEQLEEEITERTAVENDLAQERNLLKTITDNAIDFIYVKDTQGRHIFTNPALRKYLSKTHQESVVNKTNQELFGTEIGGKYDAEERTIMKTMQSQINQIESHLGQDGETVWFSTTKVPWQDDMGVVRGIVGITHDITARREADKLLEESEERFRALMEYASMAIIIIAQEGLISNINTKVVELFGYDREELLGQPLEILMPDRFRDIHVSYRKNYFGDPTMRPMEIGYELFGQHKDGSEFPVDIGLSFAQVGDQLIGMAYIIDITERKQAEKVLVESKGRYKALFNNAPVAIFTKDREGRYTTANSETLTYWSKSPIGYTDADQLPAEIADALRAVDLQVMETGQGCTLEEQILVQDKLRTLLSRKVPIRNADGDITGILGISLDITENKQTEILLADRALELERSNEELTQFAYVISHDLGEPLRAITSYLELFSRRYKGQIDDRADKYINYAVDGAVRMQALIIDLLAYSRTGKQNDKLDFIDFEEAFETSVANLWIAIQENDAMITHDDLPTALGNVSQITQLFQNLIGNAIKYRSEAPPRIHVSAKKQHQIWIFSVKDNGIGIASEYQARIFQVFQRLHTREQYPGTGIGLAICKKIVQNHGGAIWIESEVGKGSTFYFTFSRKKDFHE